MLTTTLDGLWVLQILTGIEVLAPELGLRPVLPSVETKEMALRHPVAADLLAAGVIDDHGTVDSAVAEWLTVLSRRDIALLIQAGTPERGALPAQISLARFAQWWVALERTDHLVRLSGIGTSSAEGAANLVVTGQLERLCGSNQPAPLRPVTLPVDQLLAGARDREGLRNFLINTGQVDADQFRLLMMATDPGQSAHATVVAIQTGVDSGGPARVHIEPSCVTIIDTPEGRILSEQMSRQGRRWMILAPGSSTNIASAINDMVRRLPAGDEWFSYRKVV